MLEKVASITSGHAALDNAIPDLKKAGITQTHLQGIVEYAQRVAEHARQNKDKQKVRDLEGLIDSLKNMIGYFPIPDRSPEGNTEACGMIRQAQQTNAAAMIAGLVRGEVIPRMMSAAGLSQEEAAALYNEHAQGTVGVSEGSSREVTFNVLIDIPKLDSSLELSGTVNNYGGLEGIHSLVRGDVVVEANSPVTDPSR
jgi:hypothetical protein